MKDIPRPHCTNMREQQCGEMVKKAGSGVRDLGSNARSATGSRVTFNLPPTQFPPLPNGNKNTRLSRAPMRDGLGCAL